MPSGATLRLAEFVVNTRREDIPSDVLQVSRWAILDVLGTGIAGSSEGLVKSLLPLAFPVSEGARVLGRTERTAPVLAALVNGTLCHALDFDDTYMPVPIHPSTSLVPALLAATHGRAVSGRDFLIAYAVACEFALRVGLAAGRSHIRRGWHGTGTFGTFGAAAGAGRLLRLSVDEMVAAFGAAGVQAAGLLQAAAGTMCKPLHAGKAAMNGFLAAELAATGFTAPAAVLEQPQGFGAVYSDGPIPDAYDAGLGTDYRLLDLSFKPYACCLQTHAVIDAARAIRRTDIGDLASIDRITVKVNPIGANVAGIALPARGLDGKFSLAYTFVAALSGHPMTDKSFTDEVVADPNLRDLCHRVDVEAVQGFHDTEAEVFVRLRNGKTLREHIAVARGNPGNPIQEDELERKFLALTEPLLGSEQARRLRDAVRGIEALPDASVLADLSAL